MMLLPNLLFLSPHSWSDVNHDPTTLSTPSNFIPISFHTVIPSFKVHVFQLVCPLENRLSANQVSPGSGFSVTLLECFPLGPYLGLDFSRSLILGLVHY